jgi:hypothetical protein
MSDRRHKVRPTVDLLEPRELLSGMPMPAAEVSISSAKLPKGAIVPQLATAPMFAVSTIPSNGDLNPYGVAFVPAGFPRNGVLQPGDILVSNFNNSSNLQGTGTTITRVTPSGQTSTFFPGPAGLGLTTALGVLKAGFVIVGSMPTTDGTSATAMAGSILIIDRNGNMVANLSDPNTINGPWDLTIRDEGRNAQVFVSNVLTGTIERFDIVLPHGRQVTASIHATQIASGYAHSPDPAALELGPTGLAFDARRGILYVASTLDNAIFAIHNAARLRSDNGTGRMIIQDNTHLHGPLGLVQAPNGDLIVANGDGVNADPNNPSEISEFTTSGRFVAQFPLSTMPDAPFGIALSLSGKRGRFAAVNDDTNQLEVFSVHR